MGAAANAETPQNTAKATFEEHACIYSNLLIYDEKNREKAIKWSTPPEDPAFFRWPKPSHVEFEVAFGLDAGGLDIPLSVEEPRICQNMVSRGTTQQTDFRHEIIYHLLHSSAGLERS